MLQRITSPIHAQVFRTQSVLGMTVGVVAMVQMTSVLMHSGARA